MGLYIHGNPLRAGMVKRLSDYPWSSYPSYESEEHQVPWLTTDLLLGTYQGIRQRFCEAHQWYFGEKTASILNDLKFGLYLGQGVCPRVYSKSKTRKS